MSQQINLFNPLLVKQRSMLSANNLLWTLLAVLVLVGSSAAYLQVQLRGLDKTSQRLQERLLPLNEQLSALRNAEGAKPHNPSLVKDLSNTETEIQRRQSIAGILRHRDFGNTEGYSSYMEAFARQVPNGVWLTGFSVVGAGKEISLQGRTLQAELVPLFVGQLKREAIMHGKTFSVLNLQRPRVTEATSKDSKDSRDNKEHATDAAFLEFELHTQEKNANAAAVAGAAAAAAAGVKVQ